MSGIKPGHRYALIFTLVSLGLIFSQGPFFAYAQNEDEKEKRPQRLIVMAAEYPGVEVDVDEDVQMDLIFHNRGRTDENVDVWIAEKPDGWKAKIKTYRYAVTGAHIPSGDDKTLTFEQRKRRRHRERKRRQTDHLLPGITGSVGCQV
jgi:hypothetical protein